MTFACKNPAANNFDGTATTENYSCIYLLKNQGNCHWFEDVVPDPVDDKTFTLSFSVKGQGWVFFHDYAPDMYIHTRDNLYNTKNSEIFQHNKGVPGSHHTEDQKPFFIDVVFQTDSDMLLETVDWVTEYLQQSTDQPFNTLSHISIWNSTQHTGRIPLDIIADLTNRDEIRRTKGEWTLNNFRDILIAKGTPFILDIFNDYALITDAADPDQAWYKKELLVDTWFCIRFEYENRVNAKVILHETTIQASKSIR